MGYLLQVLRFFVRVSKEVRYSRAILFLVVLTGLVSGFATTGLIAVINRALTGQGLSGGKLALAFFGLCLGLPLFRFVSTVLLVRLTQWTLHHLRLRWCRRILSSPLRHLENVGAHRLYASLTNDLGALTESLASIPLVIMHAGVVAACLIYLGYLSPFLLLFLFGFLIVGLVTYQLPVLAAIGYGRRARALYDDVVGHVRAITSGIKELKMHQPRREALMERQMARTSASMVREITRGTTLFAAASGWGQVLFYVAIGLMLFVLPSYQKLPSAVVLGYSVTLIAMMTPLEMILTSVPRLAGAAIAIRKIDELGLSLFDSSAEKDADSGAAPPDWHRVELRGVVHSYRGEVEHETFTLGPIDLALAPGELLFVVGGNGSGKTTLAKVLLGLYAPEAGKVLFDGVEVTDANRDRYRQSFAAVFSDFFLFDSLLGLEAPKLDAEARRYLAELQLERKVRIDGGALSTTDLSQGQRKRLALLTAYLEDRPIYLFDEWAADQDPTFKEVFYREILPALKRRGKTVVVISHDDRYYGVADRIVKLVYGRIVPAEPIAPSASAASAELVNPLR
ncbi:MAG TPA: cyclic peptide export ABC transporter [Thermoanaerobaculia bacterium]|nr:cyclic peptide export ABC transporter [Thermoanaerobaculia bacterium]